MGDQSEHTAGPWKWHWRSEGGLSTGSVYAEPRTGHAYAVAICPQYQKRSQWEADARLISAAPDLLAALREARETILQLKNSRWSECEGSDAEWVGGLDVVIARATGEA